MATGLAYSYLRFSCATQAWGDSTRRQHALAQAYAKQNDLHLDDSLTFRDLGTSAFRSKNARDGALRAFLDAIELGLVPQASFLLVESLDRLSRDRVLAAQGLFLQIVQAGITIVTLLDEHSYSLESLNANPTDLIVSLVFMMRANDESEAKSKRIRAAWAEKRRHLDKRPFSTKCPGWLSFDTTSRKFVIVTEKAEIVRKIYRDILAGHSQKSIAVALNEAKTPLLGQGIQKGKFWQRALIRHYLRTPTVMGVYTPCLTDYIEGVARVIPLAPVPNYYPAIVSKEDFEAVQTFRREQRDIRFFDPRHSKKVANVLARLGRCPECDRPMLLLRCAPGVDNHRYLVCVQQRDAKLCSDTWIRYSGIESTFTRGLPSVIATRPPTVLSEDQRAQKLRYISRRLRHLRLRLAEVEADWERLRDIRRPVKAPADILRMEIDQLLDERKRVKGGGNAWEDTAVDSKLQKLARLSRDATLDLVEINELLRSLFLKVVLDYKNSQALIHWKHGGSSTVPIDVSRQRQQRNPPWKGKPKDRVAASAVLSSRSTLLGKK